METSELKQRIIRELYELIDVYFNEDTFIDKMVNTTLKVLLQNNSEKIDDFLTIFSDKDGKIESEKVVKQYADQITEKGVSFDLKSMVNNEFIKSILPNKTLIISKEDIMNILK